MARVIASLLIAGSIATAVARGEANPAEKPTSPPAGERTAASEEPTLEDGERDWGRDDGIATQLTTESKLLVGAVFVVVLGCVIGVLAYRKPDGAAYPEQGSPDAG